MNTYKLVMLDEIGISEDVAKVRALREEEKTDSSEDDYKRWSIVLEKSEGHRDILDIGIGRGQFPDICKFSGKFDRVVGADFRPHSMLRNDSDFEYAAYNLTIPAPKHMKTDLVTCLECIEHIKDPGFDKAVENLKDVALNRLIVTVPFMEPLPLPHYHHQRFTAERLASLFPGSEITMFAIGRNIRWVMADWRKAAGAF